MIKKYGSSLIDMKRANIKQRLLTEKIYHEDTYENKVEILGKSMKMGELTNTIVSLFVSSYNKIGVTILGIWTQGIPQLGKSGGLDEEDKCTRKET